MPFVNIALISILMVNEMNEAKKGFTRNLNIVDFFYTVWSTMYN